MNTDQDSLALEVNIDEDMSQLVSHFPGDSQMILDERGGVHEQLPNFFDQIFDFPVDQEGLDSFQTALEDFQKDVNKTPCASLPEVPQSMVHGETTIMGTTARHDSEVRRAEDRAHHGKEKIKEELDPKILERRKRRAQYMRDVRAKKKAERLRNEAQGTADPKIPARREQHTQSMRDWRANRSTKVHDANVTEQQRDTVVSTDEVVTSSQSAEPSASMISQERSEIAVLQWLEGLQ